MGFISNSDCWSGCPPALLKLLKWSPTWLLKWVSTCIAEQTSGIIQNTGISARVGRAAARDALCRGFYSCRRRPWGVALDYGPKPSGWLIGGYCERVSGFFNTEVGDVSPVTSILKDTEKVKIFWILCSRLDCDFTATLATMGNAP